MGVSGTALPLNPMLRLAFLCIFLLGGCFVRAQSIRGDIIDIDTREPLTKVYVQNVNLDLHTTSDDSARFTIAVSAGQLLEFRKLGYKVTRLRLPDGKLPTYFRITMKKGPIELPEIEVAGSIRDYRKDSLRYRELYKSALEFERLTGLDVIRHPFSALSKRNRQIWAFQDTYNYFEQEKYVDYTFNEQLVNNLTGLTGDSVQVFLRRFRPGYDQLRAMNEYSFYVWIKEKAEEFRTGRRPYRPGMYRSTR